MNEWWKRIREQLKGLWARWNRTQKIILFSIIGAGILAVILLFSLSAAPTMVPLITNPVTDMNARLQISAKLDEMGVKYQLRADNMFYVPDDKTARHVRVVLNQENLIPRAPTRGPCSIWSGGRPPTSSAMSISSAPSPSSWSSTSSRWRMSTT